MNLYRFIPILLLGLLYFNTSYAEDITQLAEKAKSGDTDAQYDLAKKYYNGEDIEQNYAKAFYWFKKSSLGNSDEKEKSFRIENAKGDADAQFALGRMYALGEGVDGSYKLAIKWMSKAANSGSTDKQYDLAELFLSGELFPIDLAQAFYWHSRAAKGGDRDSQYTVATMLQNGEGTQKNSKRALKWFLAAAEQGKKSAFYQLATIYHHGIGVNKDYDQAQRWYEKSIASGNKEASSDLQKLEQDRFAITSGNLESSTDNKNQIIADYIESAQHGDAEAQYQLGKIYMQGIDSEVQLIKAYKWLSLAEKQGVIEALKLKTKVMKKLSAKDLMSAYRQVKDFKLSK